MFVVIMVIEVVSNIEMRSIALAWVSAVDRDLPVSVELHKS